MKRKCIVGLFAGAIIPAFGPLHTLAQEQSDPDVQTSPSAEAEAPAFFRLDYSGDIWERPALTGDWGGRRNNLAQEGISIELDLEQTIQGNAHGGKDTNNAFRYSGSWDLRLKFDTGRMGLWPGGLLELHGESFFGQSINRKVGGTPNDDALYPLPGDRDVMLSQVTFTQFLSESFGVFLGKLDTTTGDKNEFAWIHGDNFLHSAFRWNLVTARTTPYSTLGAGFFFLGDWGIWSFTAYDTEGAANVSGFDTAFDGGTSLATEARFNWEPFGKPGHQLFGFTWSDKAFVSLEQDLRGGIRIPTNPILSLLTLDLSLERESSSWSFYYNFDQYLYVDPEDSQQGVGVFGRFGISDGEANPIETFYSLGVGGTGIIPERDRDTFGLGYYFVDYGGELPERLGVRSSQGVELFYNIEVTPWCHITPDLQVIVHPGGFEDRDVAIVYGLRTHMSF
ncbi:MAG: carbohydrate porin [Phycisphaerales bacterium]|nr:MAG: carbohydrate porin [Phycisphaerales bacterium]